MYNNKYTTLENFYVANSQKEKRAIYLESMLEKMVTTRDYLSNKSKYLIRQGKKDKELIVKIKEINDKIKSLFNDLDVLWKEIGNATRTTN